MDKQGIPINLPSDQIAEFCQRHHISKLSLFGSVLRDDFTPESDVDFLVEFDPEHIPGLLTLMGMEIELTELIGREADLRTPKDLHHRFRQDVLGAAVVQYVQD